MLKLYLVAILISLANGASYYFNPFFNTGLFACPAFSCNLRCSKGYETSFLGCNMCKCRYNDPCETFGNCGKGYHCESIMKIAWLYFPYPHCAKDEVPDQKLVPRVETTTTSTTTTTTTTTTTPAPLVDVCQYGKAISSCDINTSCADSATQKCVIMNLQTGRGVCCLKYQPDPLPPDQRNEDDNDRPRCMQVADVGPCRALMPRYYYNTTMKSCMKFMYGGCHENENNFPDLETCQETCENPCEMKPRTGRCRAAILRYYFNSTSGQCESFTFGGCQGNGNNWRTLTECREKCDRSYTNSYFQGNNNLDKE